MASTQSKLFNVVLRLINKKDFLRKQLASGRLRYFDSPKPTYFARKTCRVTEFKVNNREVFSLAPREQKASAVHILYLHGGAYIQNFITLHWNFLAMLVKKTGCTIVAPDYPLAPDHTYKESFAMAETLYRDLILSNEPKNIIFMGDSAGGGFALALAQKMRNDNIPQPGKIILLSPWLDATLTNPGMKEINGFIPFAGIETLQQIGKKYAGDAGPDHYLVSPINESLEGLGKISVFIGSKDILVADARKLRSLAASKKIHMNYYEYEDMFHAWMFLNFPEAKKARHQIVDLVRHS
ncbi:MAG TPA: alpha/beta hydrolase [Chitinophagaceae bacterium]|nr:alpha/beta hydrolase [Chitinophagaceae bacterium]